MSVNETPIQKWVEGRISPFLQKLISLACCDLYSGPLQDVYIWTKDENPPDDEWVKEGDYEPEELGGYHLVTFGWAVKEIKRLWDLPSEVYHDTESDEISENEPQGYEDEDGVWVEPYWPDYKKLDPKKEYMGRELAPFI